MKVGSLIDDYIRLTTWHPASELPDSDREILGKKLISGEYRICFYSVYQKRYMTPAGLLINISKWKELE